MGGGEETGEKGKEERMREREGRRKVGKKEKKIAVLSKSSSDTHPHTHTHTHSHTSSHPHTPTPAMATELTDLNTTETRMCKGGGMCPWGPPGSAAYGKYIVSGMDKLVYIHKLLK